MSDSTQQNTTTAPAQVHEPERVNLRGVLVYPFRSADELIDFADRRKGILVAVNAEKILHANDKTKPIFNSNIAYCDGGGAVAAAKQKGANPVKIAGCELWLKIIERFHGKKTFYIIGAKPEVNKETVEKLQQMYPDLQIVGHRDGYIKTPEERQALIDDVARTKPDVVFVAMGSPTQEILMSEMLARHKAIYQGLGGSYDVFTGRVRRAPKWMCDHNLEFAFRLVEQPKRWKRNLYYIKYLWWLLWRRF